MDDTTIDEAYEKLPPVLEEYIDSDEFDQSVIELAGSFGLPISSYGPIKNACILIILGLTDARELVASLGEAIGIKEEVAKDLARKIDSTVFSTVRALLGGTREEMADEVKKLGVSTSSPSASLRSVLEPEKKAVPVAGTIPLAGSRAMLMDQLSLIGQIPKDEDVLARLSKIKEQLRKGEEGREKIDEDIRERERLERLKRAETQKVTVPRRVYDVDPYREQVADEDLEGVL